MNLLIKNDIPPIYDDNFGGFRIGKSRVLLEIILRAFQDGATPEIIVQRYPAVSLADVYSVIGYYLRHREEVDQYLSGREQSAQQVMEKISHHQKDTRDIRSRLIARSSTIRTPYVETVER